MIGLTKKYFLDPFLGRLLLQLCSHRDFALLAVFGECISLHLLVVCELGKIEPIWQISLFGRVKHLAAIGDLEVPAGVGR